MKPDWPKEGHVPTRTCIGCKRKGEPKSFFRLSNHPEQGVILVEAAAAPGRSAYLCKNEKCVTDGLSKSRLARALKTAVPEDRLDALKKELICKLQ
jgi:predicted RNA-binding protein YlxR (DUF448 family)